MKLTPEIIVAGTGCTPALANAYIGVLQAACDVNNINTKNRIAAFLANVGVESDQLTTAVENLNYSAQGLANTWSSRYAIDKKANPKAPNSLALSLARNPKAIANNVYANRLGNGDEASGDGWKYRGQGWIQTTGRANIQGELKGMGLDVDKPEALQQPQWAAMSAALFWDSKGCNQLADRDMFSATVELVNGQPPCDANKGPVRLARYRQCLNAIGK